MIWLTLLPFLVEIFGDLWLIKEGKNDIHWGWRIPMFLLASIDYNALTWVWNEPSTWSYIVLHTDYFIYCLVLYTMFDPVLNVFRFKSFKKWNYLGQSKKWDRNLLRFNPRFLLILRFVAACFLLYVAFKVG